MNLRSKLYQAVTITAIAAVIAPPAVACTITPPDPPQIWKENHGLNTNGKNETWLGVRVSDLFTPGATTQCSCGLTFLPDGTPLPAGFDVTQARLVKKNIVTLEKTILPEFDFARDNTLDDSLGAGSQGIRENWIGFSGTVNPFEISLDANEIYKLEFLIETDPGTRFDADFQFASGSSDPDHPVLYSDVGAITVPEPSNILGAGIILGLGVWLKRRSTSQSS